MKVHYPAFKIFQGDNYESLEEEIDKWCSEEKIFTEDIVQVLQSYDEEDTRLIITIFYKYDQITLK